MNTTVGIHPSIYVLMGCPGSGKGTFAQAIKAEGYEHISIGDITREEVRNETAFGLEYREAIINHVMGGIPFEKIQELVEQRLEKALLKQRGVILDGYPKTIEQCAILDTMIQKKELSERVVFVFLDVKEDDAIDRILCRQTCEKCSRIYNSKFSPSKIPDKCDECDGILANRLDNSIEGTKKRVYEYKNKIKPVVEYYKMGNRLNVLDGNATPEVCLEKFSSFHKSNILKEKHFQ